MPNGNKKSPVPLPINIPAAPTESAPDVPADFQVLSPSQVQALRKPTGDQNMNAAAVANEIKSTAKYTEDFGPKVIAQSTLHAQMASAAAWSAEAARAERWAAYANNMASLSWNTVLGSFDTFAQDFDNGLRHDATIAERYPSLTAFRGARSEAAKRAAATRKAAKNGAAKPTG